MTSSAEQEDHCYTSAFSLSSKINKSCISRQSQKLGDQHLSKPQKLNYLNALTTKRQFINNIMIKTDRP